MAKDVRLILRAPHGPDALHTLSIEWRQGAEVESEVVAEVPPFEASEMARARLVQREGEGWMEDDTGPEKASQRAPNGLWEGVRFPQQKRPLGTLS